MSCSKIVSKPNRLFMCLFMNSSKCMCFGWLLLFVDSKMDHIIKYTGIMILATCICVFVSAYVCVCELYVVDAYLSRYSIPLAKGPRAKWSLKHSLMALFLHLLQNKQNIFIDKRTHTHNMPIFLFFYLFRPIVLFNFFSRLFSSVFFRHHSNDYLRFLDVKHDLNQIYLSSNDIKLEENWFLQQRKISNKKNRNMKSKEMA